MPEKRFALEPGGPERIAVSWSGNFKDLSVTFDGAPVGTFNEAKELKEPQRFSLADGSTLTVQLASPFLIPELLVTRDGEPVPGSSGDPATRHANAWHMVLFIAVLNVGIGLLVEMFDVSFLRRIGAGWGSVLSGLLYAVLAYFVRGRSLVALAVAVALFVLDGIFMFVTAARAGGAPPVAGIVPRILFLIPMVRGFPALRALGQPRRRVPPRASARPSSARGLSPSATAAARPAAATAPAARVLSGDAERRRLQMTERVSAPAPNVLGRGPISMQGKATVDAAADALRFLARKCEIGEAGLHVTDRDGHARDVIWSAIGRLVVRQLPPDPPWEAGLIVDVVAWDGSRWLPVRVFTTTLVNFGALPGPASSSRMDNLRRFLRHVRERQPAAAVDDETALFVEGRPPARLVTMTQFAEYDAAYS